MWAIVFVFLFFDTNPTSEKSISVSYMDQAVERKRKLITKKCIKYKTKDDKGFMMIEMTVFNTGTTEIRLVGTELKSKTFVQCALAILNRTRFKKFQKGFVTRFYRFFVE